VLQRAAAGGAATSLLLTALRSGIADGVVVVGRDPNRPWVPTAIITNEEEQILQCAQTSYCITPNLHLLRDSRFSHVAVVGVPCEIQAIQKMMNLPDVPEVAQKVSLTLEIACASSTKLSGTEHMIEHRLGLPLEEVRELRYRDGDYPGEFVVTTKAGQRRTLPFHILVDEFKRFKTHRCLACGDWWSGIADISISDGDPNIYASSCSGATLPKQSKVMVRTSRGRNVLEAAIRSGTIKATSVAFKSEENLGLQRKRFRYAAYARSMPERVPTPPVPDEEKGPLLSDSEVIEHMNNHRAVQLNSLTNSSDRNRSLVRISCRVPDNQHITWIPPGDKSITLRAIMAAALADGTSTLRNTLAAEDTYNSLNVLRSLGVDVWKSGNSLIIRGCGLGGLQPPPDGATLNVGNSATMARLLIGLLSATSGEFLVDGNESLRRRPMEWVVDPLRKMGADITYCSHHGRLPVRIRGRTLQGICHASAVYSAQPVSALLFAGLQCTEATALHRLVRARDHTERLFRFLGLDIEDSDTLVRLQPAKSINSFEMFVPGDISAAALPIACTVISPHRVALEVKDVGLNETRTGFIRALQTMGADVETTIDRYEGGEPVGSIIARSERPLTGSEFAGNTLIQSMIDELPLLAAVASRAKGRTLIRDAEELRYKDTDRIDTTVRTLKLFGVPIIGRRDGLIIDGSSSLVSPQVISLPFDHRVIFAAMALASSLKEPTSMSRWSGINVSFPNCLRILSKIASVDHLDCLGTGDLS
jgi:3-phosphoshikimate 1-carboxyvinyltransferase